MDKATPCRKVDAFCGLFFAKEQGKALKGKPEGTSRSAFLSYAILVLPLMFLLQAFAIIQCLMAIRNTMQMVMLLQGASITVKEPSIPS